jgi:hypothetical protein
MRGLGAVLCLFALAGGAAVARADSAMPVEGSWRGETSAGLPVHFGVGGGRVVNPRFRFRWGFCGTYGSHDQNAGLEIDPSGHWSFQDPRGQTLEGTFVTPDLVEGRVISVERELPGCPRTEATFTATPVPLSPESLPVARAGIEELPYEIHLRQPGSVENLLIGKVFGRLGETFRFFLFVNRDAAPRIPGVPGYGFHGRRNRLPDKSIEGGQLASTDTMYATVHRRHESKTQENERYAILYAVEESICLRQTGASCAVP